MLIFIAIISFHFAAASETRCLVYLFNIWPFTIKKICPNEKNARVGSKFSHHLTLKHCQTLKTCQSGEILTHQFTLAAADFKVIAKKGREREHNLGIMQKSIWWL